jgi:hypothetical protein
MPTYSVTVEMVEYSTVVIEVEARSEEAAENKALREAKRTYYKPDELPWETYTGETEWSVEEIEEEDDAAPPKRKARTRSKAEVQPKTKRVEAKVLPLREYRALPSGR